MKKTAIIGITVLFVLFFGCKKEASATQKVTTTKVSSSNQTANAHKITFIELGSVNCVPCKMMKPVMEKVQEKYKDQVEVVFYDVWTPEQQKYSQEYKIRVIPTQVFLDKNGNEYYRHEGFFPYEELEKVLLMKL